MNIENSRIRELPTSNVSVQGAPLVTVIAICYNHDRFVTESLASIACQTYRNIQLVIMDDCSTDASVEKIREWVAEQRNKCVFIAHTENQGLCRTLNEALSHAAGKYVSLISTDDLMLPNKINGQVKQMESLGKGFGVIYSDAIQIDEKGRELADRFIKARGVTSSPPEGEIMMDLLNGNFIPVASTLILRECYDRVGWYDESLCYEDYDMWLRIARDYKFAFFKEASVEYRVLSSSMSNTVLLWHSPEYHETNFQIFYKCLRSNELDGVVKEKVLDRLVLSVGNLYKCGFQSSTRYIWNVIKYRKNLSLALMLVFSFFGISYLVFEKAVLGKRWLAALGNRLGAEKAG